MENNQHLQHIATFDKKKNFVSGIVIKSASEMA